MKKKFLLLIFSFFLLLLLVITSSKLVSNQNLDNRNKASSNNVHSIKSCKQLFLNDDYLIENNNGFVVSQNQPTKKGVVINNDQAWENEGFLSGYVSEFDKIDGSKYTLWTTARFNRGANESVWRGVEVFTSNDGINWKRPNISKFDFSGVTNNNLIAYGTEGTGKIPNGSTLEPKYGDGLFTLAGPWESRQIFRSTDGINFESISKPQDFEYYTDGGTQILWNPQTSRYQLFFRSWSPSFKNYSTAKRDFGRAVASWSWSANELFNDTWPNDLPSWIKFKGYYPALDADQFDHPFYTLDTKRDIYTSNVFKYDFADCDGKPGMYVATPDIFDISTDSGQVYLSVSRNLSDWKWADSDTPYMPLSTNGSYDSLHTNAVLNFLQVGDNLVQYYTGGNKGHDHSWANSKMFMTEQRMDGFISLDAKNSAELVTKPFTFQGNVLKLNSSSEKDGYVNIELLDENNNPIPNFTISDSLPITSDHIDNVAFWKNGADISSLVGKVIKLHIVAKNSKIYAFQTDKVDLNNITTASSSSGLISTSSTTTEPVKSVCSKYDLNGDGKIDILGDFSMFLNNSLQQDYKKVDFNDDNLVNVKDFLLFKSALYKYIDTKSCDL